MVTNLGAFGVVIALERRGEAHDLIEDYRGLAQRQPALAAAMTIFLLSFTGVPPLVGFIGKFYIFTAALQAGLVWLVVIAVLNSVMAAYYYIYIIVAMYMQEGGVAVAQDESASRVGSDHCDCACRDDFDWSLSVAVHDGGDDRIQFSVGTRPDPLGIVAAVKKKQTKHQDTKVGPVVRGR